jgi:hypothetical protein
MNKKLLIINIINYILALASIGLIIFFIIYFGFKNKKSYDASLYTLMGFSLINVLMIMFKLLVDKEYEFSKKIIIIFAGILFISVICHYIIKYVDLNIIIYWIILISSILIMIVGILIFYHIKENKTKEA